MTEPPRKERCVMNKKMGAVDTVLVSAVLSLLALGIVMVYSASAVSAEVHFDDAYYFLKRQLIWTAIALGANVVVGVT